MAKYSKPVHPKTAQTLYNGQPGNYTLHFENGDQYPGRQSKGGRRISTHARKYADLTAVQFMHDHEDNPCLRAKRENQTLTKLKKAGTPVRNRIKPSMPKACCTLRHSTTTQPSAPLKKSKTGVVLAVLGGLGILLAAATKK